MLIPSFFCFLIVYFLSFIYVMCTDDWILVWLGLEFNMMSYIVLIYKRYDMYVLESCLKYFLIQSVGSIVVLMGFYFNLTSELFATLILSYKLGAGPFYYWFPSLCSGLGWISCFFLMTFQKVMPLFLMSMFVNKYLLVIIMISLLMGALGSFNQVDIKCLMAYSSIHHLGWIILCFYKDDMFWLFYLCMYFFMLLSLFFFLMKFDLYSVYSLMKCKYKFWLMIAIMSYGGIPPFLGFFLKLLAFMYIINYSYMFIMFLLLVSVIMLYIYMRLVYDLLMLNKINMSFSSYSTLYYWNFILDYINGFGILLGTMLGLFIII